LIHFGPKTLKINEYRHCNPITLSFLGVKRISQPILNQ